MIDTVWANVRLSDGTRITIGRDITERKRVEEALRESEERFRQLAENVREVFWLTSPDSKHMLYVSPAYDSVWGRPRETLYQDASSFMDAVHPEDRPFVSDNLAGVPGNEFEFEYRIIKPDGSVRWIRDRRFPVRDQSGQVYRLAGIAEDITERKLAEEKLRENRELFRSAFDHAAIGMALVSPDGRWLQVNHSLCEIVGYSEQELLATTFQAITHPDDLVADLAYVHQMLAGQISSYQMEKRYRHKLGHTVWVLLGVSLVRDGQGNPLYFISQIQDITVRKQAEVQLKTTSEQLRALMASLGSAREEEGVRIAREIHDELGSALTSLKWDLEGMDKIFSDSGNRSQLPALRKKIGAMMRLADTTINAVRRISSELRPSILDDLGLVEAIEWQAQQFQARTGIICRCDCSAENINLNREQSTAVFRIFQEAVTNVLRHAQATRVDIMIEEEAGELVLTITDDGKGITESEKTGPQSLGLLGMRERAHLIGGEINITGGEGKGTVVTVRVPVSG